MSFESGDQADLVLPPADTGQSAINTAALGAAAIIDLNGSWGTPAMAGRFKNGMAGVTALGGAVYFSFINGGTATCYVRFRQRTVGAANPSAGTTAANGVPIAAGGRLDLWVPFNLSLLDVFGSNGSLVFWASSRAS